MPPQQRPRARARFLVAPSRLLNPPASPSPSGKRSKPTVCGDYWTREPPSANVGAPEQ
jgi:hypothetical protein